jgi:hypothetical protein
MEEHDRIAEENLEEADRLQRASDDLKQDIRDTREDWESKQGQEAVPGAVDPDRYYPDEEEDEDEPVEPEYQELNPQAADASGGGDSDSDGGDSDGDSGDDE